MYASHVKVNTAPWSGDECWYLREVMRKENRFTSSTTHILCRVTYTNRTERCSCSMGNTSVLTIQSGSHVAYDVHPRMTDCVSLPIRVYG